MPVATPPLAKPEGEMMIVVDTIQLKLTLYVDGEPYKTYPVAVGRPNQFTLSPVGEWRIVHKSRNWGGGFGTRWMGLNVPWGIYGIHGTNKPWSIGTRASAGCIRMFNRDVEELYAWVPERNAGQDHRHRTRRLIRPSHAYRRLRTRRRLRPAPAARVGV